MGGGISCCKSILNKARYLLANKSFMGYNKLLRKLGSFVLSVIARVKDRAFSLVAE